MGQIRVRDTLRRWLETKIKYDETGPRKWTYRDLAKEVDASPSLLYKVMSGHRNVTTRMMMKICDGTHHDLGELFYYDRDAKPRSPRVKKGNGEKADHSID